MSAALDWSVCYDNGCYYCIAIVITSFDDLKPSAGDTYVFNISCLFRCYTISIAINEANMDC